MRITAIRMRNTRILDGKPVAIERIPKNLSVLCKPNEFGKSTIFLALKIVLLEKHSTKKNVVKNLVYNQNLPIVIETEFSNNQRTYRLRKQFLNDACTELFSFNRKESYLDDKALDWMTNKIHGLGSEELNGGLLWVNQGSSSVQPKLDNKTENFFVNLLEQEIHQVIGGETSRQILNEVTDELTKYRTATGRIRKTQRDSLIKSLDEVNETIRCYEAKLKKIEHLRKKKAEVAQAIQDLTEDDKIDSINIKIETLNHKLIEASVAHEVIKILYSQLNDKELSIQRYTNDLGEYRHHITNVIELKKQLEHLREKRTDNVEITKLYKKNLKLARDSEEQVRKERNISETLVDLGLVLEHENDAKERADLLWNDIEYAESIKKGIELLSRKLDLNLISDEVLEKLKEARWRLKESLGQISIEITTSLTPLGKTTVTGNGQPLSDSNSFSEKLVLSMGKFGRIVAESNFRDNDDASIGSDETIDLSSLLKLYGVCSIEEAERLADERKQLEHKLELLLYHFYQVAPEGISALRYRYDLELTRLGDNDFFEDSFTDLPDRRVVEEQWKYWRVRYDEVLRRLGASEIAYSESVSRGTEIDVRIEQLNDRLKESINKVGSSSQYSERIDKLEQAIKVAKQEKEFLHSEITKKQLIASKKSALVTELKKLVNDKERMNLEAQMLRVKASEVDRDLDNLSELEVNNSLAVQHQKRTCLQEKIEEYESRVPALIRLESVLIDSQRSLRDRYLKPVLRELEPLLKIVFPDVQVALGGDFYLEELKRSGKVDTIDTLSGGTREQIAVLTRLAFAQLMAKRGREMPVILDDALVWCDDQRLENVFRALRSAARDIQCIVLTCHEKGFSTLGAPVLEVQKWPQTD